MKLEQGAHITVDGKEYELTARAKCGCLRGWMVRAVEQVRTRRERFIADQEVTGALDKKTGQYFLLFE